ncbi:cysteine-rich secretory protein lccl domain-containing 2 [Plakobranchus ocellatus]|uniref:Cysteine-rich secretory protein lccl domain-containing 2 n=1 Tax=Plakobranchus ocellatus TaxID=259542 RepID=A0AAV4D784_9GAST|nr:cysteine-rich secretory protein lccl domain-containing 2 [Plakobranchus ocellatus]
MSYFNDILNHGKRYQDHVRHAEDTFKSLRSHNFTDMDLEAQAKAWTEGCVFEHEMIDERGENLAYDTSRISEEDLIKSASKSWFDEKNIYTYGQPNCGRSCHYTQMVWDDTLRIGCYSARCPRLLYAFSQDPAWYFVCFYTPNGNWANEKPYEKSCDSPCRTGQIQENGLCVDGDGSVEGAGGSTVTDGGTQTGGSTVTDGGTQTGGSTVTDGGTQTGGSTVTDGGTQTGGSTDSGEDTHTDGNSVTDAGTQTSGTGCSGSSKSTEETCKDDHSNCPGWASNQQCEVNPGYMLIHCKKSCHVCGGDESTQEAAEDCKDYNNYCPDWAAHGHCVANPGYMLVHCKKSCGEC